MTPGSRPDLDGDGLSRLGFVVVSLERVAGLLGLRLRNRDILEPRVDAARQLTLVSPYYVGRRPAAPRSPGSSPRLSRIGVQYRHRRSMAWLTACSGLSQTHHREIPVSLMPAWRSQQGYRHPSAASAPTLITGLFSRKKCRQIRRQLSAQKPGMDSQYRGNTRNVAE